MRAARLAASRSRTRSGLLLALFAVIAIVVFLLSGMIGYPAGTTDLAVRQALAAGPPTDASVQVQTRLAGDRSEQTDAMEQLIGDALGDVDTAVYRTLRSNPVAASRDGQQVNVILAAIPDLHDRVEIVAGSLPVFTPGTGTVPVQAAVHAVAAAAFGLEVGDTFTIEGTQVIVAATWQPTRPTEPYWFSDPAVASGYDRLSLGPVVIAEDVLAALPVRTYANWTIVPEGDAITGASLPALARGLEALAIAADRVGGTDNVEVDGGLADRVAAVQRSIGVAQGLVAVPVALVGVIGAIGLGQLARLLVAARRSETVLLRARGASVTQLTLAALIECGAVTLAGSAFGTAVLVGLLAIAPVNMAAAAANAWPMALIAAGGSLLICVGVAWHAALTGVGVATRTDTGRTRTSVTAGVAVLVLAAAAVSLWQFKLYGSPLIARADGGIEADPLTIFAPALTLLALAVLGLLAFGPVVSLLERTASRRRGVLPALPSRQVARRVSVFGTAVLLVTLGVSGTTLVAGYSATWNTADSAAARLRTGADVRVQVDAPTAVDGTSSQLTSVPYLRLPGADDAATVLSIPVRLADESANLTAIAASRIPRVMSSIGGIVDTRRLAAVLPSDSSGVALAVGATELAITVRASAPAGQRDGVIEAFAWLEDEDGALVRVTLGGTSLADARSEAVRVVGALPEARMGQWTVLALSATLSEAGGARDVAVTLGGLGREYAVALSSAEPTARVTTYPEQPPMGVVVTEGLAARFGLQAGSGFTLRIPGTASVIDAVVAGTAEAIPGARTGLSVLADLPTLNRYLLQASERVPQANEVWIATEAGADLATAAVVASRASARVTTLSDDATAQLVKPALAALWWGMAGALMLAITAVLAITMTFAQDRRGEVIVLRAIGMSSSEQGRSRLVELVTVLGAAIAAGLMSGLIASGLTVREMMAAAVGDVAPAELRFDLLGLTALVFATVAALLTISTGYAGRIAGQARDTEYREETR